MTKRNRRRRHAEALRPVAAPAIEDLAKARVNPDLFDELGAHDLMLGLDGILGDPDTLGPDVWDKMHLDAQVKACDLVITLPIKRMEFHLTAATDRGKQIAKWCEDAILAMDDTPHYYIGQALTMLRYGRAAGELVWRMADDYVVLRKLKFYHPNSWQPKLHTEKKTLVGISQRVGTKEIVIPANGHKLAVFVHEKEFGNWYGRSLYRASHKPWTIKEFGQRMWNVAMERWASPLLAGKVPQGGDLGYMLQIINGIKTKAGVALPDGYELEVKTATQNGLSYNEFLLYQDKQIARGMFVPDLLFANDKSGSWALGDSQANFFIMREDSIAMDLEDVLTKFVVAPMVAFNFPDAKPADYPRWKFAGLTKEDKKELSELVERMINGNVVEPDEPWIRERLGLPPAEDDAKKKLKRLGLNQAQALKLMIESKALKVNDVRTMIFGLEPMTDEELEALKPPAPIAGQAPGAPGQQVPPAGQKPGKPGQKPDKAGQKGPNPAEGPDKEKMADDMLKRLHQELATMLGLGEVE